MCIRDSYILVLSFVALIGLVSFTWRELTYDHPVVDFRILKNRAFSIGIFTTFILGFGLFGSVFIFPIFAQNLLGFTAQQTGEMPVSYTHLRAHETPEHLV